MACVNCLLVVDDDRDILLSLQDALEAEGYRVMTASTGREALERLKHGLHPDLILLDLMMPDVSGWAFRTWQRSEKEFASIPVVVVSGQGLSGSEVARLGVEGYLSKPLELDNLLETVARFVPAPHEEEEMASW